MPVVLHLSDLHFGNDHFWGKEGRPGLEIAINNAFDTCNDLKEPIDILIITGDLTSKGIRKDYKLLKLFLDKLLTHPKMDKLKDILVVPGNHDFPFFYSKRVKGKIKNQTKREINYRWFQNIILSNIRKELMNKNYIKEMPSLQSFQEAMNEHLIDISYILEENKNGKVAYLFYGLNSMKIDSIEHRGIGYFEENQRNLIEKISYCCQNDLRGYEVVIISICHHHLVPVAFVERAYLRNIRGKMAKHCSVTLDARAVLDTLQKIGCRIVLHGHHHQPACISWRDRISDKNRTINIIGAGSAGVKREDLGDISKHHFFIHKFNKSSVEICSFLTGVNNYRFVKNKETSTIIFWPPIDSPEEDCILAYIEPKQSEKIPWTNIEDQSNLFFLFLNVVNCKMTRHHIIEFKRQWADIQICSMYDLYGKYDSLVKYRAKTSKIGREFSDKLQEYLSKPTIYQVTDESGVAWLDIKKEEYNLFHGKESDNYLILLPDEKAYEDALWTCCFIEIYLYGKPLHSSAFIGKLLDKLNDVRYESIKNIIKGTYISSSESVLFELKMSCKQFHYLNKLSRLIEKIIDPKIITKTTHIAYAHQEFIA